jgi:RNA polymerase-binding transcription factor DksA
VLNIASGIVPAVQLVMATSADILGTIRRPKIPARWARYYDQLCDERDKVLNRDRSSTEGFQPKLDDLGDAASQETETSLTLVAASATQGHIQEVLDAIRRIERGLYGICEITGEPIATERLNSVPWARYSLAGQQQMEQAGFARRTGLPSLQGLTGPEAAEAELEAESE